MPDIVVVNEGRDTAHFSLSANNTFLPAKLSPHSELSMQLRYDQNKQTTLFTFQSSKLCLFSREKDSCLHSLGKTE